MTELVSSMSRETAAALMSAAVQRYCQEQGANFPDAEVERLRESLVEGRTFFCGFRRDSTNDGLTAISYDGGLFDLAGWTVIVESLGGFHRTRQLYATLEAGVADALLSKRETALLQVIEAINIWHHDRFGTPIRSHDRNDLFVRLIRGSSYTWFIGHDERTLQLRVNLINDRYPVEVMYHINGLVDPGVDELLSFEGSQALRDALGDDLAVARG